MNFEMLDQFTLLNDERLRICLGHMFKVTAEDQVGDWTIYHNTEIKMDPKIYIHLMKKYC